MVLDWEPRGLALGGRAQSASNEGAAVRGYPQGSPGGHGGQALTHTLALHGVPHVAVEVIVARKEQAATEAKATDVMPQMMLSREA